MTNARSAFQPKNFHDPVDAAFARHRDVAVRVEAARRAGVVLECTAADRADVAAQELVQLAINAAALLSRQPRGGKLIGGAAHDPPPAQ